jgi:hypothetical protein
MTSPAAGVAVRSLPAWAQELVDAYESNSASQFLIYGNVEDRLVVPGSPARMGSLTEFLLETLLPGFDVVLSYDLGNGVRVEKGGAVFSKWPTAKSGSELSKQPRAAIEFLTHYFRYSANLARLNHEPVQIACLIKGVDLIAPSLRGGMDYDLGAIVTLIRDWASDGALADYPLATFLIAENLNDVHPLLTRNPRAHQEQIPLPSPEELASAFQVLSSRYPKPLSNRTQNAERVAGALAGSTLAAAEKLLKAKEHAAEELTAADLAGIKKQIVEADCRGLIEFVESRKTLDAISGGEAIKAWLRQDIALWEKGDVAALPKGYLLCGPVGTGKSFTVECLAGEAGVPVVKFGNFRDKWVGSTEGNLERIFRLLRALGRCYVFIDEADQSLGKRESGGDSGVSGRVYSMIAEEMGSSASRGRIIWVLASSRPDLIEVDLKRPGRVDVKIPLLPTATAAEGFELIRFLCRSRGLEIGEDRFAELAPAIPVLLTPGAAETIAVKTYRLMRTKAIEPAAALAECLQQYRPPVAIETIEFQMALAIAEASDPSFVPAAFSSLLKRQ